MKNIPSEVVEYVQSVMEDYQYANNMRIANTRSKEQLEDYEKIKSGGCCGFVDYQLFLWKGEKYQFGFNYGH